MPQDPLIDEIRTARHRISERFGHDTKALMDHYRALEDKYRHRMLKEPALQTSPAPRRAEPTDE